MSYRLTYFFFFIFWGAFYNLVPAHFQSLGISGYKRSLFFGIIPVIAFFANIMWGRIADMFHIRRQLLLFFSLVSFVFLNYAFLKDTFPFYMAMAVIIGLLISPVIPLLDSITITYCRHKKLAFGRIRQWGTISFVLINAVIMLLFYCLKNNPEAEKCLLFFMPLTFLLMIFPLLTLKDYTVREKFPHLRDFMNILKQPLLFLFFSSVLFHNLSYVGNYSYFSAHLKILGFSGEFISLCWAVAPLGEILIFRYADKILDRWPNKRIFQAALVAAGLRWAILGFFDHPVLIIAGQMLHSIGFGAYYLASIQLLTQSIPERMRSSGQGIFAACISLATVFGNIITAVIFEKYGTHAIFQFSILMSAAALLISCKMTRIDLKKQQIMP